MQTVKDKYKYCKMIMGLYLSKIGVQLIILACLLSFVIPYINAVGICVVLYILNLCNRGLNTFHEKMNYMYYDDKSPAILEALITDCLTEYIIFNRGYDKPTFISATEENKIMSTIVDMVVLRLSPTLKKKLELYYNEYSLDTIISSKIYMAVLAYVINNNKIEQDNRVLRKPNKTKFGVTMPF
jgi:hypothetical protein